MQASELSRELLQWVAPAAARKKFQDAVDRAELNGEEPPEMPYYKGVSRPEYTDILQQGGFGNSVGMLQEVQQLFTQNGLEQWIWQEDGARIHGVTGPEQGLMAAIKTQFAAELLMWPSHSPDLSIIENVWAEVERRLWLGGQHWHDTFTFTAAIRHHWNAVTSDTGYMKKLYKSMATRVKECIVVRGAKTKH